MCQNPSPTDGWEDCGHVVEFTMDMYGHISECDFCKGTGWVRKRDARGRFIS